MCCHTLVVKHKRAQRKSQMNDYCTDKVLVRGTAAEP